MISDLYDSIVEAFERYGCPAKVYLGEQYRSQHTETLRVIMWQGSSSPADSFGGHSAASLSPTQRIQFVNPRPVATRKCGFSVELWATAPEQRFPADQFRANQAYLDALVNQFVAVLQQIASGVYTVQGGLAAAGNADADVAGLGYTLQCSCDVPIIDVAWPSQQLSECSKTWQYSGATAEVTIAGKVDPETPFYQNQPPFTVPTPED